MSDQNCADFDQIVSTGRPVGTSGPASDVPYVQGLRLEAVPKAGLGLHKLCQCPALQASTWHQLHKASKQHSACTASLFPFFFFPFFLCLLTDLTFKIELSFWARSSVLSLLLLVYPRQKSPALCFAPPSQLLQTHFRCETSRVSSFCSIYFSGGEANNNSILNLRVLRKCRMAEALAWWCSAQALQPLNYGSALPQPTQISPAGIEVVRRKDCGTCLSSCHRCAWRSVLGYCLNSDEWIETMRTQPGLCIEVSCADVAQDLWADQSL